MITTNKDSCTVRAIKYNRSRTVSHSFIISMKSIWNKHFYFFLYSLIRTLVLYSEPSFTRTVLILTDWLCVFHPQDVLVCMVHEFEWICSLKQTLSFTDQRWLHVTSHYDLHWAHYCETSCTALPGRHRQKTGLFSDSGSVSYVSTFF